MEIKYRYMYVVMILKFLFYAELAIDHTITKEFQRIPDWTLQLLICLFFHARYTAALDHGWPVSTNITTSSQPIASLEQ
jgi:hypothetical protein